MEMCCPSSDTQTFPFSHLPSCLSYIPQVYFVLSYLISQPSLQAAALAVPWPLSLALSRTTFLWGRRVTQGSTIPTWLIRLYKSRFKLWDPLHILCASFMMNKEKDRAETQGKVGYLIPYLVVSGQPHQPNLWTISMAYVSHNTLKSRTHI